MELTIGNLHLDDRTKYSRESGADPFQLLRIYKDLKRPEKAKGKYKYGVYFAITYDEETGQRMISLFFNKISIEWEDRLFILMFEYLRKLAELFPQKSKNDKDSEITTLKRKLSSNTSKSLSDVQRKDSTNSNIKEVKEEPLLNETKDDDLNTVLSEIKCEIHFLKLYNKNKRIYQNLIELSKLDVLVQDFEKYGMRKIFLTGEYLEVSSLVDYPFTKTGHQLKKFKDCVKRRMLKFGNLTKNNQEKIDCKFGGFEEMYPKIKKVMLFYQ